MCRLFSYVRNFFLHSIVSFTHLMNSRNWEMGKNCETVTASAHLYYFFDASWKEDEEGTTTRSYGFLLMSSSTAWRKCSCWFLSCDERKIGAFKCPQTTQLSGSFLRSTFPQNQQWIVRWWWCKGRWTACAHGTFNSSAINFFTIIAFISLNLSFIFLLTSLPVFCALCSLSLKSFLSPAFFSPCRVLLPAASSTATTFSPSVNNCALSI